jgi:hypothetical protein
LGESSKVSKVPASLQLLASTISFPCSSKGRQSSRHYTFFAVFRIVAVARFGFTYPILPVSEQFQRSCFWEWVVRWWGGSLASINQSISIVPCIDLFRLEGLGNISGKQK